MRARQRAYWQTIMMPGTNEVVPQIVQIANMIRWPLHMGVPRDMGSVHELVRLPQNDARRFAVHYRNPSAHAGSPNNITSFPMPTLNTNPVGTREVRLTVPFRLFDAMPDNQGRPTYDRYFVFYITYEQRASHMNFPGRSSGLHTDSNVHGQWREYGAAFGWENTFLRPINSRLPAVNPPLDRRRSTFRASAHGVPADRELGDYFIYVHDSQRWEGFPYNLWRWHDN